MAICVGAGRPFLGRQTRQVKVSYFDLEEWIELLQQRRVAIGYGNGIVKSSVRYAMEMSGGEVSVLQDLQRHINEGSKLLIIDLLARVRDELNEDAKKNAYTRDYAALTKFSNFVLREYPDVAIVIVHHTNKGQHEDWQSKISGSQGLAGASHCNMMLANLDMRGLDDDGRTEALKYRRFHAVGNLVQDQELMLTKMENGGGWAVSEKTADEVKLHGTHAHILQVLREANGEWVTAKAVSEQVDASLAAVKKALLRMAKKGEIESSGSGGQGYRLPVDD
jgi:RecA-family ATPase